MTGVPARLLDMASAVTKSVWNDGFAGLISGARAKLRYNVFFARFHWWERQGIHVTPVRPWSPIPDTRAIAGDGWPSSTDLPGIEVCADSQLDFLTTCQEKYSEGYAGIGAVGPDDAVHDRYGSFEPVDGEILYCMVREQNPDRIVQVGGGFSTQIIAHAIDDGSLDCTLEVCEPYRDALEADPPEACSLTGEWAHGIGRDWVDRFDPGDILFVDSSHVLRTGNPVYTLMFEIIPRLPDGVLIHFHDIFLPYEYPKEWILDRAWFLNEQYMIRSFLEFNDGVDVRWMSGYMHQNHPEALETAFEHYDSSRVGEGGEMHIPNSLWLAVSR